MRLVETQTEDDPVIDSQQVLVRQTYAGGQVPPLPHASAGEGHSNPMSMQTDPPPAVPAHPHNMPFPKPGPHGCGMGQAETGEQGLEDPAVDGMPAVIKTGAAHATPIPLSTTRRSSRSPRMFSARSEGC